MIAARALRHAHDARVLAAASLHGAAAIGLLSAVATGGAPARAAMAAALAIAMCWGSNTVSHVHLHAPLFRRALANHAFSLYLSVLLGVPQTWWKLRHLDHHGLPPARTGGRVRALGALGLIEFAAVIGTLSVLALGATALFTQVVLPSLIAGYGLCWLQGREEHARGAAGVDHRGRLYNRLSFNDGYHAAHHRDPGAHWTMLPARAAADDVTSVWPPLLRVVEGFSAASNRAVATALDRLEAATLSWPLVRRFMLATHERAFAAVLAGVDRRDIREVTIIGGGLFPRSALVLRRLLPSARLTIVDAVPAHLERARAILARAGSANVRENVRWIAGSYDPSPACDLLVVPLAFRGDRALFYRQPPAPLVAVHDWIWRPRGAIGAIVSPLLLKRLNLAGPTAATCRQASACDPRAHGDPVARLLLPPRYPAPRPARPGC